MMPDEIYIQGSAQALELLKSLPERGLAVVGTRNPQPRSILMVQKWIEKLGNSQLIIISGLARGIDAAAHWSALKAGLPTIAVVASGLDSTYPEENRALREKIVESHGLIISEFAPGQMPRRHHFLQRNRLIAGWAKATWIVESAYGSGALNTARWAREQERTCFATPCFPGDPALSGNQALLDKDQAYPIWDIHNLGSVWLELAAPLSKKASTPANHQLENLLAQHVKHLTFEQGGVHVTEILDWAISKNWSPQLFFTILESSIRKNLIIDKEGILLNI